MPNATVRANARALPETTDADRRRIMRTFLALTGAVAASTVWNVGKTKAEETPNEGELVSLGQRLEKLTRERETAQSLRVEARARFEKIVPKHTPLIDRPELLQLQDLGQPHRPAQARSSCIDGATLADCVPSLRRRKTHRPSRRSRRRRSNPDMRSQPSAFGRLTSRFMTRRRAHSKSKPRPSRAREPRRLRCWASDRYGRGWNPISFTRAP